MQTETINMPGVNNLYKVAGLYLAGQPVLEVIPKLKEMGITKVYNIRSEGELDFSEHEAEFKKHGIEYIFLPIMLDGALNPAAIKQLNAMIDKNETNFIHCGSANRVAGWLITYLVQNEGMDFEQAVSVAQNSGLKSVEFIEQAQNFINA